MKLFIVTDHYNARFDDDVQVFFTLEEATSALAAVGIDSYMAYRDAQEDEPREDVFFYEVEVDDGRLAEAVAQANAAVGRIGRP